MGYEGHTVYGEDADMHLAHASAQYIRSNFGLNLHSLSRGRCRLSALLSQSCPLSCAATIGAVRYLSC